MEDNSNKISQGEFFEDDIDMDIDDMELGD